MDRGKARTTVVIPNHNGEKFIDECLKSVFSSSVNVDVIVVDNGSSDGSIGIIEEKFPKTRLVKLDRNTGFCHAVNEGIALCETEFVYLLNNDTVIMHDTIKQLENTMDSYKDAFSVQSKMLKMCDKTHVDSAGDYYCVMGWAFSAGKDKSASYYEHGVKRVFSACAGAALYRMDMLKKIGFFDEAHFAYLEDVDIGYRARINGLRNYINLDSEILHAGSAASGSRYNEFKAFHSARNSVYIIYKNMPPVQILLNVPFLVVGFFVKTLFYIKKGLGLKYVNGLIKGLDMCVSGKYSDNRVKFKPSRLLTYIMLELELLAAPVRKFL
ncbi:MAG: glycosyltransferase family 2 protein [Lachnospiraceae bacterium]|nr:glycosyltransferase family 2 protein [Lachnospiraceae bacterium]